MLLGKTNISLDTKGRIAIPARYREQLVDACDGKLVVVFNPMDGCLSIYPYGEWQKCIRKMEQVQNNSNEWRELQRMIYAFANEVDMDGSGRVLIPQELREHVGLQKNAVLIGHNEKFELWAEEEWLRVSKEGVDKLMQSLQSKPDRPDIGFTM